MNDHTERRNSGRRLAVAILAGLLIGTLVYAGWWWAIIDPLQSVPGADLPMARVFGRLAAIAAASIGGNGAWIYQPEGDAS